MNPYGEKSLAGLMAHPALYAKLMWMAASPRPMRGATSPEGTSMLRLSVTARMMTRRQAVARAWSTISVAVEELGLGNEAKMPAPCTFLPNAAAGSLMPSA